MWPFKRKEHPNAKALEMVFEQCNFILARDEIADFFKLQTPKQHVKANK